MLSLLNAGGVNTDVLTLLGEDSGSFFLVSSRLHPVHISFLMIVFLYSFAVKKNHSQE